MFNHCTSLDRGVRNDLAYSLTAVSLSTAFMMMTPDINIAKLFFFISNTPDN
jgi:hypothetical protein